MHRCARALLRNMYQKNEQTFDDGNHTNNKEFYVCNVHQETQVGIRFSLLLHFQHR